MSIGQWPKNTSRDLGLRDCRQHLLGRGIEPCILAAYEVAVIKKVQQVCHSSLTPQSDEALWAIIDGMEKERDEWAAGYEIGPS
jgi:hypothetical protein